MKISQEGIDLIKRFEGCRLKAYKALPTEKEFTIGYGHYGSDVKEGMVITQKQADDLLVKDLERFEGYVASATKHLSLNINEFSALVSFTYNCGPGNLKRLVAERNTDQIANMIMSFNHAGGKELAGLTKRRKAERELFLKPVEDENMKIIIGSARIAEDGSVSGRAGDQKQKSTPDYSGEVSLQEFYEHKKGWYILRPILPANAILLAHYMEKACDNFHLGYNQNLRFQIIEYGIDTDRPCNCDCSSLLRQCVIEATGIDPGDFTTYNEASKLEATGLFEKRIKYTKGMKIYEGDVLVTCEKGHTAICVEGYKRNELAKSAKVSKKGNKIEITVPTIKKGSYGTAVDIWQRLMGEVFIISEFDDEVEAKTKAFQEKHGLKVDGVVGKQSWTKGFEQL